MAKRFDKAREYTQKYKNILLPCKHCGNENITITSERKIFNDNNTYWAVNCSTHACDCTGLYTNVKDAITRWNEMQTTELNM